MSPPPGPFGPGSESGPVVAITRIGFRHWWRAAMALLRFRALYRTTRSNQALLRGSVSVVGAHTLVNLSVWTDRRSLLLWTGTEVHVRAVQWTYPYTTEVWSVLCSIDYLSASGWRWAGEFDPERSADEAHGSMRHRLGDAGRTPTSKSIVKPS